MVEALTEIRIRKETVVCPRLLENNRGRPYINGTANPPITPMRYV